MRKKIIKIFLFFIVSIFIWGGILNFRSELANPTISSNGWSQKTNPDYGFSIEYPDEWYATIHDENGYKGNKEVKFSATNSSFAGSAFVDVLHRSISNPDLEIVEKWSRRLARGSNIDMIQTEYAEYLEGQEILRTSYSNQDYYYEHIGIPRENDMIIIVFVVEKELYGNYIEIFEHIASSFKSIE